jgi:hypothetical protein
MKFLDSETDHDHDLKAKVTCLIWDELKKKMWYVKPEAMDFTVYKVS